MRSVEVHGRSRNDRRGRENGCQDLMKTVVQAIFDRRIRVPRCSIVVAVAHCIRFEALEQFWARRMVAGYARHLCCMSPHGAGGQLDPFRVAVIVAGVVFYAAQQFVGVAASAVVEK